MDSSDKIGDPLGAGPAAWPKLHQYLASADAQLLRDWQQRQEKLQASLTLPPGDQGQMSQTVLDPAEKASDKVSTSQKSFDDISASPKHAPQEGKVSDDSEMVTSLISSATFPGFRNDSQAHNKSKLSSPVKQALSPAIHAKQDTSSEALHDTAEDRPAMLNQSGVADDDNLSSDAGFVSASPSTSNNNVDIPHGDPPAVSKNGSTEQDGAASRQPPPKKSELRKRLTKGNYDDIPIKPLGDPSASFEALMLQKLDTEAQQSSVRPVPSGRTFLRRGQGLARFSGKKPSSDAVQSQTPVVPASIAMDSSEALPGKQSTMSHAGRQNVLVQSSPSPEMKISPSVLSAVAESLSGGQQQRGNTLNPSRSGVSPAKSLTPVTGQGLPSSNYSSAPTSGTESSPLSKSGSAENIVSIFYTLLLQGRGMQSTAESSFYVIHYELVLFKCLPL